MNLDNCSAVITGASAGIGREFATQLAARAKSLVLVARRLDRLAELKRELTGRHSAPHIETLSVDLSNMEQLTDLSVRLAHGNVDLLINNAGLGDHGPVATAESARVHRQIQVNVLALTALTSAVLPQMISRKRGALLNVSSSAGF